MKAQKIMNEMMIAHNKLILRDKLTEREEMLISIQMNYGLVNGSRKLARQL